LNSGESFIETSVRLIVFSHAWRKCHLRRDS